MQANLSGQTCIAQARREHQLGRAKLPAAAVRRDQSIRVRDALHRVAGPQLHAPPVHAVCSARSSLSGLTWPSIGE
jgi:hypothetical protein